MLKLLLSLRIQLACVSVRAPINQKSHLNATHSFVPDAPLLRINAD
jgi:hypothetical protein